LIPAIRAIKIPLFRSRAGSGSAREKAEKYNEKCSRDQCKRS
jgi:hypothetical protein